ncbi:MAG: tetratricopeptide repeat protein [Hyphomicrobiaceae bacterium]|nr:tetratricopeptide repeat protein [Hyphomicrobiaceae bacterium]
MSGRPCALLGTALALGLAAVLNVAAPAAAAAGDPAAEAVVQPSSQLGSYLAGRLAAKRLDAPSAAAFYGKALQADPDSAMLIDSALQMEASQGNWSRAEALAKELIKVEPNNRVAHVLLGISAFNAGRFAEAEEDFKGSGTHPIGELTNILARAWILQAQGKTDEALAVIDAAKLPDWANTFVRYHRALLADVAGRTSEARTSYSRISKNDQRILRVALAYARHAANSGDPKLAQTILNANFERAKGEGHPYARALFAEIEAGKRPQLLITSPSEGLAELFYGLGELLASEPAPAAGDPVTLRLGIVFLQFALNLSPNATFPLLALAGAEESAKHFGSAIDAYNRIPRGGPLEVSIDISKAFNLNQLERVDEAQSLLEELARQHSRDVRPLEALGNIMRAHKRFAEAAEYYTRAIALLSQPEAKHWTFFYERGTCYERLKKLPESEADLQRSLKLSGDQPLTLNYLGYTWIDHNRYLKKGLQMIEKAVRLKPDDGYIVDSLGWAHYRLGNFNDAVKYLEQAVVLKPEDATLNDHLGDAYWRVGREREARFQWDQALKLNPEPEDAEKIKQKLQKGLSGAQSRQARRGREVRSEAAPKRRSAVNAPSAQ